MKHFIHFTNVLFRARSQIIIALLFFSAIAIAQESTPEDFIFGGTWNWNERHNEPFYDTFRVSGMNYLTQYADDGSQGLLQGLNFSAYNSMFPNEWIYYYSTAYYSKWEAEENQIDTLKVGFKHIVRIDENNIDTVGSPATFLGRQCWSTEGLSEAADSLLYGPHYHQEKVYKRWYVGQPDSLRWDVRFTPRFSMALHLNDENIDPEEAVCRLYVRETYRYQINNQIVGGNRHQLLKEIILKVSDFAPYNTFKIFYLGDPDWYKYPEKFQDPHDGSNRRENLQTQDTLYFDRWGGQGVQFCIDWLRNDTKCNLYIDYVEVYDNDGWNRYLSNPQEVEDSIIAYAQRFPASQWPNMKYWGGPDEPSSIDDYVPMKTVDAILESINAPRLISTFYPWWEVEVNGDTQLVRYYNTVHPKKLMIDFFPFLDFRVPASFADFDNTREMFQICSTLQPGFWYQAQAFGTKVNGQWNVWRFPDTSEYKAQIMLALAHGVKGIINYTFTSLRGENNGTWGIINPDGTPYTEHNLYSVIKHNLVPRLKGTLGKTLLGLNYSGVYLELRKYMGPNTGESVTENYLTLSTTPQNPTPLTYYFHAGFFDKLYQPDNHHFFLTNLITTDDRYVNVKVINDCSVFLNTRFRNIEPEANFDTTFTCEFSTDMLFPPGEGYLYQVAPVVKYGGKLIYNETISTTTTLFDEMVIQNGATLTVNSTYNVDRDIRIKAGGRIITTNGGTLKFYAGSKLIIEGAATIAGTASHNLILDFLSPGDSNGIIINQGGSLTISYCEIRNANTGIFSERNANYLNAQNVNFINCSSVSINILGRGPDQLPTPPPQIKFCTITNSNYGIHISNLSEVIIQGNIINNTNWAIFLSSVTNVSVINNQINTNTEVVPGIFANSTGGSIRGNNITGHTTGIYFANASSMNVGGNIITGCLSHGMFVGDGSVLNMTGKLVQDLGHHYYYAISGYNKIYENGGFEGPGDDNDGSEIFFSGKKSSAILDKGCNSIFDDREPSPPLINTELLMNCPFGDEITVSARHNYWGETEVNAHRFGNMLVDYRDALSDSCHLPDNSGGADGLIVKSSFGDVIDTVYSNGEEGENLTETEIAYSEAEENFLTGDMTIALHLYDGIIASGATDEEKYLAYERKYEIGRMTGQSPEYFNQLGAAFTTLASNAQDSVSQKILNQHSILCKVGEQEYEESIGDFDAIIQQNPNTDEAVYAEIDAITAAILIEEADSTLHKGRLGKYLIKPGENYFTKLDGILRKHFGNGNKESEKETLPTEYTLYQNYPNPFNPVTTIKYDLPNAGNVSLVIYDILGRKVKELLNTKQEAGRYEIQFNASYLASGVYIYQLIAEKYISAKKMILLK